MYLSAPLVVAGGGGGGGGGEGVVIGVKKFRVKKFRLYNSTTAVICSTNLDFITPWHHCPLHESRCTERSGNQTIQFRRRYLPKYCSICLFCTIMTVTQLILTITNNKFKLVTIRKEGR